MLTHQLVRLGETKEMAHPRCSHYLAKASILSDLKQHAHLVYCVCTKVKTDRETESVGGCWGGDVWVC
jgi:hypothetical protein